MKTQLLLASASPRRRELIEKLGLPCECVSVDADETVAPGTKPSDAALSVAVRKARAAQQLHAAEGRYIISADTMVVLDGVIYGKPSCEDEAAAMLRLLSGRTHEVLTGVCIISPTGRTLSFCDKAEVEFYPLSDDEIEQYISTEEPMDKAGAYGIQGYGALLIKGIHGDFYNIMGLPVARLKRAIELMTKE